MADALNPDTAAVVAIDRFSAEAGHLFVRTAGNGMPAANAPIDFDQAPFITRGLGPLGGSVQYYNFDVLSRTPAPIYVLFKPGAAEPVPGQLNIIDVIPGSAAYNDFWLVTKVMVPKDYEANTITSAAEIASAGLTTASTTKLVNCPVVPAGSTAALRLNGESNELHRGWYRGQVVTYFTFSESDLMTDGEGKVPVSDIYVTFNANPSESDPSSGPPSGFVTESGSDQAHNVVETLPASSLYSPLWDVNVYDNADFGAVSNLASAQGSHVLAEGVAQVNCPIVSLP